MIGDDGNIIVRNHKTQTSIGKKQFLLQIKNTPFFVVDEYSDSDANIDLVGYENCLISPTILSTEFLDYLQLSEFKEEYEKHPNIGLFDFDRFRELNSGLVYRGKRNILYSKSGDTYNISVKWDSFKGWRSVKGTKASIGAFLKAEKPTSTLILTEGLKDAINANIAFPTADILSVNGKSNRYNFREWNINLDSYRYIIFANDRDAESSLINMFPIEHKKYYKRTKYINWDLIKKGKDLTDIIENHILSVCKTKRDRTRKALSTLKKFLHKSSFEVEYKRLRAIEGEKTLKLGIESNNRAMVMRAIKTVNMFGGDIRDGAEYYLKKQNEVRGESLVLKLKSDNRLSEYTSSIVSTLNKNKKVFLNAPTGTGKSYTSLKELPKYYKNIVIVSPLRMVTNEHGAEDTPYTNVKFDDKFEAVEADMSSNYIAITTDVFVKLWDRYRDTFKERLKNADLIIFDEQHLYYDSLGFRDETVVRCYEYLLYQYSGKTFLCPVFQ